MRATVLTITAAGLLVGAGAIAQAQQSGPQASGFAPGRESTTGAAGRDDRMGFDRDDRMRNQGTTGAGDRDDRPRTDRDELLRRDDER